MQRGANCALVVRRCAEVEKVVVDFAKKLIAQMDSSQATMRRASGVLDPVFCTVCTPVVISPIGPMHVIPGAHTRSFTEMVKADLHASKSSRTPASHMAEDFSHTKET
jgi:hypothetical protein